MFFSVSYSFCSSRAIAFCNFQYRICWWYYGRNGETHRLPLPRLTRALVLCIVCRHMYKLRKIDRHHRSTYIFLSGEDQQLYWKRGETVRGTPTDRPTEIILESIYCVYHNRNHEVTQIYNASEYGAPSMPSIEEKRHNWSEEITFIYFYDLSFISSVSVISLGSFFQTPTFSILCVRL